MTAPILIGKAHSGYSCLERGGIREVSFNRWLFSLNCNGFILHILTQGLTLIAPQLANPSILVRRLPRLPQRGKEIGREISLPLRITLPLSVGLSKHGFAVKFASDNDSLVGELIAFARLCPCFALLPASVSWRKKV
jgi:hypothetical protein